MTIQISTETFRPVDETSWPSSRRQDGWSAANQCLFLKAIAEGFGVEAAAYRVGLSASSAYAFRRTAKGAAFALGWRAATLLARDCVADTLMVRALDGQIDSYERADGTTVTRHRHDNRLAMSLLARLDRQVEQAPDADVKAARLVAQEFDAFLGLVGADEGPARAGLFLARRAGDLADETGRDLAPIYALAAADRMVRTGVSTAEEVDVSDLDPSARAQWSADQWQRAEAAGMLALAVPAPETAPTETSPAETSLSPQHSQHSLVEETYPEEIWWDDRCEEWRTCFPPPAGFCGYDQNTPDHVDYQRVMTPEEIELLGPSPDHHDAEQMQALAERYTVWIAQGRAALPAP